MFYITQFVPITISVIISLFSFSLVEAKNIKVPIEALDVAQKFTDAINESRFSDAFELTDKKSKIAPAWFSSLKNFSERAKQERPFSETHPGKSKIQESKLIDSHTLSVEIFYQFEVRLCRQSTKIWKVCYFQSHAG